MLIGYKGTSSFEDMLALDDCGNFAIRCTNNLFLQWFMCAKTIRGKFHYLTFGPVFVDKPDLPTKYGFYIKYGSMKFNEQKIYAAISSFINDPKKELETVVEDDFDIIIEEIPQIGKLFKDLN